MSEGRPLTGRKISIFSGYHELGKHYENELKRLEDPENSLYNRNDVTGRVKDVLPDPNPNSNPLQNLMDKERRGEFRL